MAREHVNKYKNYIANLGKFQANIDEAIARFWEQHIMARIWKHDHTVWKPDPAEITNRLGWLHSPETTMNAFDEINEFMTDVKNSGFTNALLLGMGGSSLAPEVFQLIFGVNKNGFLDLMILDSTDPAAVLEYKNQFDPTKTLYIVSTKSGGTVETLSFMKFFYNYVQSELGADTVGEHFVAITDPGSGLEKIAKKLKFRKIFLNDPNIGGRFSALSFFGTVPAALVGVDLKQLLSRTKIMIDSCSDSKVDTCSHLGIVIGEMAKIGKDKLTIILSKSFAPFGAWAEQLIAESTGKEGKGILPVTGEEIVDPGYYADDRLFIYLKMKDENEHDKNVASFKSAGHPVVEMTLNDVYDLGAEFFRWEIATAVAGWSLNINPFDQPNVESAKVRAREMMNLYRKQGKLPDDEPALQEKGIKYYGETKAENVGQAFRIFLSKAKPGKSYIALQAYLKPSEEMNDALHQLRTIIQKELHVTTTLGYGPRFLHSTGQLHKGDAGNGLFIQLTADMPLDAAIPDEPGEEASSISFGILKTAQFLGDRQALLDNNRQVIRIDLGRDPFTSIKRITEIL